MKALTYKQVLAYGFVSRPHGLARVRGGTTRLSTRFDPWGLCISPYSCVHYSDYILSTTHGIVI